MNQFNVSRFYGDMFSYENHQQFLPDGCVFSSGKQTRFERSIHNRSTVLLGDYGVAIKIIFLTMQKVWGIVPNIIKCCGEEHRGLENVAKHGFNQLGDSSHQKINVDYKLCS